MYDRTVVYYRRTVVYDRTVVYYRRTVGCMTGLLCITEGLWGV